MGISLIFNKSIKKVLDQKMYKGNINMFLAPDYWIVNFPSFALYNAFGIFFMGEGGGALKFVVRTSYKVVSP